MQLYQIINHSETQYDSREDMRFKIWRCIRRISIQSVRFITD